MKQILRIELKFHSPAGIARATGWLAPCILGILLFSTAGAQGATATEAWVRRYNSGEVGSEERAYKVVTDTDGNAIIAGYTNEGTNGVDMLIIKYSGTAVALWTNRFNRFHATRKAQDFPTAMAVDNGGNVFVTGYSLLNGTSGGDYATVAYSAAGVPLWTNFYGTYSYSISAAVAVDVTGNVFVTGYAIFNGYYDFVTIAYSGAGLPLWTNRYDGPGHNEDNASAVAVDDASGNVIVTGTSRGSGGNSDFATIAYTGAGVPLWTNRYNGPGNSNDIATAVAVDKSGNVFVTGHSYGIGGSLASFDFATIAYSASGVALWTNRHSRLGVDHEYAYAMAVDGSGNVFVTGAWYGSFGISEYETIAYSGTGVELWSNRYRGPGHSNNVATAVAVGNSGNVFVTGYSAGSQGNGEYATIAYSGTGMPLWTNRYKGLGNGNDEASAVAADGSGKVFVTGGSFGNDLDAATIAYSDAGVALWTNRYNGPRNVQDYANAVAVDRSNNVFVTGYSYGSAGNFDYATIRYSAAGVAIWTNRYNGPDSSADYPNAMAVDGSGNVFVTGYSYGSSGFSDYATIAYSGAGVALWTNRYRGPGNSNHVATAVAVDNSGNVLVTGYSAGTGSGEDYATIAYSGTGVPLWTNRYTGTGNANDRASAIAVDNSGSAFVTGYSGFIPVGGIPVYTTIAYSGAGVPLWTNHFSGPGSSVAYAVAVNGNGNVFVTGGAVGPSPESSYDYVTIAYLGTGVPLWTNRYNGTGNGTDRTDQAYAVAVDGSGDVFVTGASTGTGGTLEFATIAYSGSGVALWTNRYNGLSNSGGYAVAAAVDNAGNVIVSGPSFGPGIAGNSDYATVAYSAAGVALWTNLYNGPANGEERMQPISCLAIGPDGAVYVTGSSDGDYGGGLAFDYATVKYVWQPHLTIRPFEAGSSTVNLELSGTPNSSWSIERALMISGPWTNLGLSLIGANGLGSFQDPIPPASGAFYRATQP